MKDVTLLGPAAPEIGWVPAPRYVLRRRRILRQLRDVLPCGVLEIGCGAGMLLQELAAIGFHCTALESSPQARDCAERISSTTGRAIELHAEPKSDWAGRFPLVMAFEVLEHIEDDIQALRAWASWLSPGGTLLISVPAHPSQWNAADEWAGHFRRYRAKDLVRLIAEVGLSIEHFDCLGFPLGNLTEKLQARAIRKEQRNDGLIDRAANNARSGVDRDHVMRWYPLMKSPPGQLALRCALAAQAMSSRLPLGNGFLLRARAR